VSDIVYRTFRNNDPPKLLRLWHRCELGRGAARPFSTDAFEQVNYAQPYFDREGLILAESEGEVIGFIHAGFGFTSDHSAIDHSRGVICVVMVRCDFRRRGIGRELVRRAEEYLRQKGAQTIVAGQSRGADPFYFTLYGGSRPCGFLESDPLAGPFFLALDYEPGETFGVFDRDLTVKKDPFSMRMMGIRRKTELAIADQPFHPSYWWFCHFGRFDSLRFRLVDKQTHEPLAAISVLGLDHYIPVWNERAIGLGDVFVHEDHRGKGVGQTLLVETVRSLRQELISRAEIHAPDAHPHAGKAILSAGFNRIETGTVYHKREDSSSR